MNSILGKWIKKRNKSDFVVLILLGVMVMIVAMPTGAKQSQKETQTQEQKEQQLQTEDSYKEQLQQQLKELLEHMDGVGKTRVMLTFSDEGTDQLDKNVTKDGNKKEETTVVYDTGDTRQPYVICRQMPKIEGVVVVAQGGGNAKTVTEISNAVMSLFPVEAHKVVVVKMSVQEDKNQIVITTLAVLIAVAGYVTYDKKGADIKDAETVANMNQGAVSDQADKDYETGEDLDITSSKEDLANASTEDVENPGETVLTSVTSGDSDYAAKVKLNREQVRSKNKETLQAIIDNDSLDESKKKDAVNEMITLTDIAEKESNAEMMLEAKGFTDVVVSMNDDGCDVVLNMGEATDAKRAQVEDIVKRKTGVSADKIVITPIQ